MNCNIFLRFRSAVESLGDDLFELQSACTAFHFHTSPTPDMPLQHAVGSVFKISLLWAQQVQYQISIFKTPSYGINRPILDLYFEDN